MTLDMWSAIERERNALADHLDQLEASDWAKPTQCDLWDVKAVAAHVVLPFHMSKPQFMMRLLRNRRDVERTINELTTKVNASLSTRDIIQSLRDNATSRWKPPRTTAAVPLAEIVVHAQDIRRAVGIEHEVAPEVLSALLEGIDDEAVRADYRSRATLG